MPYFYQEGHIHFSMSWAESKKTIESTQIQLPFLMYLSIDFSCLGLEARLEKRMLRWYEYQSGKDGYDYSDHPEPIAEEKADKQIAACIDSITAKCPLLRTFTLHLLSGHYSEEPYHLWDDSEKDFLREALESEFDRTAHTVQALKKLKVRDTIVIVAVARDHYNAIDYMYYDVRKVFARVNQWSVLVLRKWPGISLTEKQVREVKCLACVMTLDYEPEIRLWYFQPQGSKALILPEYELLGNAFGPYCDSDDDDSDADDLEEVG